VFAVTVIATLECCPPRSGVTIMVYWAALTLVNEPALMVPFSMSISSTVKDPSLMILLKLKVIVLAIVFVPPLPVIVRVGLMESSTKQCL
jgi:hypothetical protein